MTAIHSYSKKYTESTQTSPEYLLKLAHEVLTIEMDGIETIRERLGNTFVEALLLLSSCKGRVIVTGVGKSGLVGRKIAATFSSTGTPAFFMHPVEGAHGDIGSLKSSDLILSISNSGETPELNAIVPTIKSFGTPMIALTSVLNSTLAKAANVVLHTEVPKEACPHGLAPTASTTAVLALGDAIAVCLMSLKSFTEKDFLRYHPGGMLGQRLTLSVTEVMRTDGLPTVHLGTSQCNALKILDKGGLGVVLIIDKKNTVCGIITDGDVRRSICYNRLKQDAPVEQIMTPRPKCGKPQDTIAILLDIMEQKAITVLPIVDDNYKLLGIVHIHDLLGKGTIIFSDR